jgi:hypothetical protein
MTLTLDGIFSLKDATTLTISGGVVTATQSVHIIAAQSGTTDDLDTITPASIQSGYGGLTLIVADAGDTIALKHQTDNLYIPGGDDAILTENNYALFYYDGSNQILVNQGVFDKVAGATIAVGAEGGSDDINVTIQLTHQMGGDLASRAAVQIYLADDANGDTPSAVAPDGGMAIGTDGALIEWTANLSGLAISEADGDIDITIIDSGTPTFYLIVVLPSGELVASAAITFA